MYACGTKHVSKCKWRENSHEGLGEHGLARARRATHGYIVTPRRGDDKSAFGCLLSAYIGKVNGCWVLGYLHMSSWCWFESGFKGRTLETLKGSTLG